MSVIAFATEGFSATLSARIDLMLVYKHYKPIFRSKEGIQKKFKKKRRNIFLVDGEKQRSTRAFILGEKARNSRTYSMPLTPNNVKRRFIGATLLARARRIF